MTFRCVAALRDCSLQSSRVGVLMANLSLEIGKVAICGNVCCCCRKEDYLLCKAVWGCAIWFSSVTYWIALL